MRGKPVLLAVAVAGCGVLPAFLTGGLAVQMREDLDFGVARLGLAVAAFFAASSLLSIPAGRVTERVGAHSGMRLASGTSAVALLAVALLAGSWGGLVVCLVLGGCANALAHPSTHLSLAREVSAGRQGLSFGIKQSAIPAATLLTGLALPTIAVTAGWRWAYVGAAALALLIAALVPRKEPSASFLSSSRKHGETARSAALVMLALGIGLGTAAATPLGGFVVEYAVSRGIEIERAGIMLALGSVAGIAVRVTLGYLADGMKRGRLLLVAVMLGVGILGFLGLASGQRSLVAAATLVAFAAGWGWPGIFNFAIVKSSPAAPAAATGVTQAGASAGAACGPLIFGLIVAFASYGVAWTLSAFLAAAALLTILVGRGMLLRDRLTQTDPGTEPNARSALDAPG